MAVSSRLWHIATEKGLMYAPNPQGGANGRPPVQLRCKLDVSGGRLPSLTLKVRREGDQAGTGN